MVFDGDSLTFGYPDATTSYPIQLNALLPAPSYDRVMVNVASSGLTLAMIVARAALVDAIFYTPAGKKILTIWGGTNDMGVAEGVSGAVAYARLVSYCNSRRAAGWKVVVLTCLPRTWPGDPVDFETQRTAFNTLIRANWATFADALCDVALDSRIGIDGDQLDPTYFKGDKTHLQPAGYAIIAALVKPILEAL